MGVQWGQIGAEYRFNMIERSLVQERNNHILFSNLVFGKFRTLSTDYLNHKQGKLQESSI